MSGESNTAPNWLERSPPIPRVSRLGDLEIVIRIGGVGHILYRYDAAKLADEIKEAVSDGE